MKKQAKTVGSDFDYGDCPQTPTPKLSLFSLPNKPLEQPEMATPPIRTLVSIPFKWEEAPGKPRPCPGNATQSKPKTARCLELPPRLLNEVKVSNLPSPTTVLDGPYLGRSLSSHSLSFRKGRSSIWGDTFSGKVNNKGSVVFGSSRWGNFMPTKDVRTGGGFDFSSSVIDGNTSSAYDASGGFDSKTKVMITRVKRRSSFMNLPSTKSHMFTSIKESIKQVVPWRLKQEKSRKIY